MLLLYFGLAIFAFAIAYSIGLCRFYSVKKGLPIQVIPFGLMVAPIISFGFAINFLFNKEMNFSILEAVTMTFLPLFYAFSCYLAEKREKSNFYKVGIDFIFATILVLSLPISDKNTFFNSFLPNGYAIPIWLDNLLTIPFMVYIVNSFKKKDDFEGFTSMFIAVMGFGVCALVIPLSSTINIGYSYLSLSVAAAGVIAFAFNRFPAKIPMTNSGSATLVLSFVWVCLGISSNNHSLIVFVVFSYIITEDIICMIKKMILKIKFMRNLKINDEPYYLQAKDRGIKPDVIVSYIMKWHLALILVAFALSSVNSSTRGQSIAVLVLTGYSVTYMVSKFGVKDPSIKEITNEMMTDIKSAVKDMKSRVKNKDNDN